MKKILFAVVAVLTISASVYVYTQKQNAVTLNDLAMENVEALASGESSSYWCCGSSGTCSINWGSGSYYSGTFRVAPC